MKARVVKGKVIHGSEQYLPGSIILDLSPEDHARIIACGIAEAYDEEEAMPEEPAEPEESHPVAKQVKKK